MQMSQYQIDLSFNQNINDDEVGDDVTKRRKIVWVIFPNEENLKRTDESFRQKKDKGDHHGTSPLTQIQPPIDMIYAFILDYMHLYSLGITKYYSKNIGSNQDHVAN